MPDTNGFNVVAYDSDPASPTFGSYGTDFGWFATEAEASAERESLFQQGVGTKLVPFDVDSFMEAAAEPRQEPTYAWLHSMQAFA